MKVNGIYQMRAKRRKEDKGENKIKIYMAGPMFNEAAVNQRFMEADKLEDRLKAEGLDDRVELYVPLRADINDKSTLPTASDIFEKDRDELYSSDLIIACLDDEDAGTMAEIGMMYDKIPILSYITDIRIGTAGEYDKHHVPYGYNQFVIGLLEDQGEIKYHFDEVIEDVIETLSNEIKTNGK